LIAEHEPRPFADDAAVRAIGEGLVACTLSRSEWTHEAHLAACLYIIAERPELVAERDLPGIIRSFNESVGGVNDEVQGYHETITQCFVCGVRRHLARSAVSLPLAEKVNGLLRSEEGRRDWPLRFYSEARLFSVAARLAFVEPDLQPLPSSAGRNPMPEVEPLVHPLRCRYVSAQGSPPEQEKEQMADLSQVREHMEIIGADEVHVGTVDKVEGDRIKMTKPDSGSHSSHHHYISGGLVAAVEGNRVRLSANADAAVLLEEEKGGEGIFDGGVNWKTVGIGAAAAAGVAAAAGAVLYKRRKGEESDGD
jgi:hypothetical protein